MLPWASWQCGRKAVSVQMVRASPGDSRQRRQLQQRWPGPPHGGAGGERRPPGLGRSAALGPGGLLAAGSQQPAAARRPSPAAQLLPAGRAARPLPIGCPPRRAAPCPRRGPAHGRVVTLPPPTARFLGSAALAFPRCLRCPSAPRRRRAGGAAAASRAPRAGLASLRSAV